MILSPPWRCGGERRPRGGGLVRPPPQVMGCGFGRLAGLGGGCGRRRVRLREGLRGGPQLQPVGAVLVEGSQGAIEGFDHGERGAGRKGQRPTVGVEQLVRLAAEAEGGPGGGLALVVKGQDIGQSLSRGGGAPGRGGLGRGHGEAPVEALDELGQEAVGRLVGVDTGQAQLQGEALLQGAPQALDPTLGLGRAGGEVMDAELMQRASELGEAGGVAGQLLLEGQLLRLGREKEGCRSL